MGETAKFEAYFRRMRNANPQEAAKIGLRYLGTHPLNGAGQKIVFWLSGVGDYTGLLLDPKLLTTSEAEHAAKILRDGDSKFSARMVDASQSSLSVEGLNRVISILQATGDGGPLVARLMTLTTHHDERLRSKAVKALCELRPTYGLVKRQLESEDARVRANAVEALWYVPTEEVRDIFRIARNDTNHRVAVNALLGLHYQNDRSALGDLHKMAGHNSRDFRGAAIWAIARLKDRRSIPALEKLAEAGLDGVIRTKAKLLLAELIPASVEVAVAVPVAEQAPQFVEFPPVEEEKAAAEPAAEPMYVPAFKTF